MNGCYLANSLATMLSCLRATVRATVCATLCDVVRALMQVDTMRNDRGGLVQHAAQLTYLHAAVTEFAEK